MNRGLIIFGMICTIIGTMIGFYLIFSSPMPRFILFGEAHAQTSNLDELSGYMNTLSAFTSACNNALDNQAVQAACAQIFNEEHDLLKPFMDQNRDLMSRVILGP